MITATEAAELFNRPPFTIEEVEQRIRQKAVSQSYTCFEKARLSSEVIDKLKDAGFEVVTGAEDFIVRWKA